MSTGTFVRTMPETYHALVNKFPLIHIEDDDHLTEAQELLDELLRMELDKGEQAYLDALTDLVAVYEDEHVAIPSAPPEGVLVELMNANSLTQRGLADKVGIAQSTIAALVTGQREFTREHIVKLAQFFNVPSVVFLGV